MKYATFSLCIALMGAPALLQAHTHKRLLGTLQSVDASRLVLALKDGSTRSIPLAKETRVLVGEKAVGRDQLKPGLRVVVVLAEDDTTAETIKLPAAPEKK